ncbi:MAG: glycosyltransferase family 2 protein [Nitrospiraceae bacterium]|nr:glycosyltransferase family 2 protein [Nitrospiraceae bacterium]
MIFGKKIIVVMPAFNSARTLDRTYREIPREYIDDVILVDDASTDETVRLAKDLKIKSIVHPENRGYGANQKTCYFQALREAADVIIMLHPDYQYTPRLLVAMASLVANGQYDIVIGSRILSEGALKGGMPLYKYASNRALTLFQNILLRKKLSEYHTGYRAFSRRVLETLPLGEDSDGFVFDNQMLAQAVFFGFSIGEISCPARYFDGASSIDFRRSVRYGLGVLRTSIQFRLQRLGLAHFAIFDPAGAKLPRAMENTQGK